MPEVIRVGPLELRFLQSKDDTAWSLDMFEMTVPPAARMPQAHHHRDWDETVYGLGGTLTFTLAGAPVALGPGQHLFIPRGTVHRFDNHGASAATCLCVLTPGVLGPGYFRELGALLAVGPPDPGAVREIMLRHGLVPADP